MNYYTLAYTALGNVSGSRRTTEVKMDTALDEILFHLNQVRGDLLTSSYEDPGRYKRREIGFINPPLQLTTRENAFTISSLNPRGQVLLPTLFQHLSAQSQLQQISLITTSQVKFDPQNSYSQKNNAVNNRQPLQSSAKFSRFLRVIKTSI